MNSKKLRTPRKTKKHLKKRGLYVARKNLKMTVPIFNIPAEKSCPGRTPLCVKHCYAKKAERAYPDALPSRMENWDETRNATFVADMIALVRTRTRKNPNFRIHESGDFYAQKYLDKWCEVIAAVPGVKFLAYTKSFTGFKNTPTGSLDFTAALDLPNLSLIWSVWPDTDLSKVPPGPRAYSGDCGPADAFKCPMHCDACMLCWNKEFLNAKKVDIHFHIH